MLVRQKKAQSVIEYAIVFAVIVAALLIMQVFIKRGYQGGLKDAADKMGDQFSAGGTTIAQNRTLDTTGQTIKQEVATTSTIKNFSEASGARGDIVDQDVYSAETRTGGETTAETKQKTDSAAGEKTRWGDYQTTNQTDFPAPF